MNTFSYISLSTRYTLEMTRSFVDMLTITIGWEWALGIVGLLILLAWKGSARFTALETSMQWVKDTLHELKTIIDNQSAPAQAFGAGSPVELKPVGIEWLDESGLKAFIDTHKDELMAYCQTKKDTNPYEVQRHVFQVFDSYAFPPEIEDRLKTFAFEKGTSMTVMRRVGAIYFRDICLEQFGMKKEDIDSHELENPKKAS